MDSGKSNGLPLACPLQLFPGPYLDHLRVLRVECRESQRFMLVNAKI
jgi:hypothetical protein